MIIRAAALVAMLVITPSVVAAPAPELREYWNTIEVGSNELLLYSIRSIDNIRANPDGIVEIRSVGNPSNRNLLNIWARCVRSGKTDVTFEAVDEFGSTHRYLIHITCAEKDTEK